MTNQQHLNTLIKAFKSALAHCDPDTRDILASVSQPSIDALATALIPPPAEPAASIVE